MRSVASSRNCATTCCKQNRPEISEESHTNDVNMEASGTEVWSLLCNGGKLSRDQGEERLKELLSLQDDGRGEREERLAQQLKHLAKNHAAESREAASMSKFNFYDFPYELLKVRKDVDDIT